METLLLDASWPARLAAVAVLLFGTTAVFTAVAFAIERRLAHRRIFAVPLRPGQRRRELKNAALFLAMATVAFTALLAAVDWRGRGWLAGLATFSACWLGFEVYYYSLHRAMHTRRLIRFHREHHESHVNTPLTAFSMSIVEGLGWLVGYALVPLVMTALAAPVSLAGYMTYVGFNFWTNVLGHVNTEVVPEFVGQRRHSWTAHAITYHALHHARYTGHYSFYSTFMDRWLGSEWRDWPELHARALAGEPMTSLKARGRG